MFLNTTTTTTTKSNNTNNNKYNLEKDIPNSFLTFMLIQIIHTLTHPLVLNRYSHYRNYLRERYAKHLNTWRPQHHSQTRYTYPEHHYMWNYTNFERQHQLETYLQSVFYTNYITCKTLPKGSKLLVAFCSPPSSGVLRPSSECCVLEEVVLVLDFLT